MVWQTAKAVRIPVIGLGGISDADSALQFIMAGASAIQIGTSNFTDPHTCEIVLDGIADFCHRQGIKKISEIVGII